MGNPDRDLRVLVVGASLSSTSLNNRLAAFTAKLVTDKGATTDLATIDRLQRTIATDDEIVALREQIVRETTARFREGEVTAAQYVDRQTDLLTARITRAQHRVELAQARANYLTTLGVQVH